MGPNLSQLISKKQFRMIGLPTSPPSFMAPLALQLLDPYTCIITEIPIRLNQSILQTHQLVPSFKHKGYATKLKMLNSLKRCLEELGLALVELPNSSFKMFKVVNGIGPTAHKRPDFNDASKSRKLVKGVGINRPFNKNLNGIMGFKMHRRPFLCLGRWILCAHQRQTVQYFMKRGRRMVIADSWNMGKTVTSLACAQQSQSKRVLVVVPKQLLCHWAWHIVQIGFSLYASSRGKISHSKMGSEQGNKDVVHLQICDFEQMTHKQSWENREVKGLKKAEKNEVKFKKEEGGKERTIIYSLCSYDYLRNRKNAQYPVFSSYSCLILDEPRVKSCDTNGVRESESEKKWNIEKEQMKQLQQIESMIICKQLTIEKTRTLLPYLNTKLSEEEIYSRYGREEQTLHNSNEYIQSVAKYYYHANAHLSAATPGPLIKHVMISNYKGAQGQEELDRGRNLAVMRYVEHLHSKNEGKYQYILVLSQAQLVAEYRERLEEMGIENAMVSGYRNKKGVIYVGTLAQVIGQLKQCGSKPQKNICIMCESNRIGGRQRSYEEQMQELYKYSNIEYLEYCSITHTLQIKANALITTYHFHRSQLTDPTLLPPHLDSRAYVDRLLMEAQYVSSGDEANPKGRDPEHYQDSQSSIINNNNNNNCMMLDQSQQIKQLWQPEHITPQKIEAADPDNSDKHRTQGNQIEIVDSKQALHHCKAIPGNSNSNNNIIEICLDSEQEQSNRSIRHPHQQEQHFNKPIPIPSSQPIPQHLMDIEIPLIHQHITTNNNNTSNHNKIQLQQEHEHEHVHEHEPSMVTVNRRGRKKKDKASNKAPMMGNEDRGQIGRMTTRRSSRSKQQKSKDVNVNVNVENKKDEVEHKQEKMGGEEKIERMPTPSKERARQWIQIASQSSSHTMALTPKKPKIPKCKSKQVLSIKLMPKLSHVSFEFK